MRFRDKQNGAIYEPASDEVAAMMAANENLEPIEDAEQKPKAKRAASKKAEAKAE